MSSTSPTNQTKSQFDDFIDDAKNVKISIPKHWLEVCQKRRNILLGGLILILSVIPLCRIYFDYFNTEARVSRCFANDDLKNSERHFENNVCPYNRGEYINFDSECGPTNQVQYYLCSFIHYVIMISMICWIILKYNKLAYQIELLKFRAVCEKSITKKQIFGGIILGFLVDKLVSFLGSLNSELRCEWNFGNHSDRFRSLHIQNRSIKSYSVLLYKMNWSALEFLIVLFIIGFLFLAEYSIRSQAIVSDPNLSKAGLKGISYKVINLKEAYGLYKTYKRKYKINEENKMKIFYAHLLHAIQLQYIEPLE